MILATIDPGAGGTGYAIGNTAVPYPETVGVIECSSGPWESRAQAIVAGTLSVLPSQPSAVLGVEKPFIATHGRAGASARRGDVVKLALLAGGIGFGFPGRTVWVEVEDWKGQLTKDLSTSRTRRTLRNRGAPCLSVLQDLPDHAWDATGIWLHLQGSDINLVPR